MVLPLAAKLGLGPVQLSGDGRLPERAKTVIRFAAMGTEAELQRAAQAGYFDGAGAGGMHVRPYMVAPRQ